MEDKSKSIDQIDAETAENLLKNTTKCERKIIKNEILIEHICML